MSIGEERIGHGDPLLAGANRKRGWGESPATCNEGQFRVTTYGVRSISKGLFVCPYMIDATDEQI